MFPRISTLASPSPTALNYSTPPRSTPQNPSQNTPESLIKANHATKALNFSSPSPFHLGSSSNQPESPWRTPHSSDKQTSDKPILQWSSLTNHELCTTQPFTVTSSSVMATPESVSSMAMDTLNSSSSSDIDGLGSRHQQIINDSGKRGRPRADVITHLILEGSSSPSGIKCRICNRVFPREKSLQVLQMIFLFHLFYIIHHFINFAKLNSSIVSFYRLIYAHIQVKNHIHVTTRDVLNLFDNPDNSRRIKDCMQEKSPLCAQPQGKFSLFS